MRRKAKIESLSHNYDNEFSKLKNGEHGEDWYDTHAFMMYNEAKLAMESLYLYNKIEEIRERLKNKGPLAYFSMLNLLIDALPYRIVMGLNKVFSGTNDEYDLEKTINALSRIPRLKKDKNVNEIIDEIRAFIYGNEMIPIIIAYRNKVFAHLDKKCVMSDVRIDPGFAMGRINVEDVSLGVELIYKLYVACFGFEPPRLDEVVTDDQIMALITHI